ncbi:MAG TPA: hypothetical protein H9703_04465 [Candidatus Faecalibacterium faecigallinarum]|uniref:Uncharacterized protein n=1 Tax=Candidatus Faecalibacterium faecigallinarum TaxID=2838577 RepID=A0A9D2T543_9FIRM|nr:hypothetical protein [Candidatus Faecalibacterium faecigallinarum]
MTAGEAMEQARAMRPGCEVNEERLRDWLRRQDGEIRARIIEPGGAAADFAEAGADRLGADGLADGAALLVPFPFDGMYPHYLCAMMDAALGENERYAGEMTRCNALLGEFAAWLRRSRRPPARQVIW